MRRRAWYAMHRQPQQGVCADHAPVATGKVKGALPLAHVVLVVSLVPAAEPDFDPVPMAEPRAPFATVHVLEQPACRPEAMTHVDQVPGEATHGCMHPRSTA